jgi:magnesium-transporting ATPase (P-type)
MFSKKHKMFQSKFWEDIVPGDIIKIKENQEFPADVLLLDVISNADHNCYVLGS